MGVVRSFYTFFYSNVPSSHEKDFFFTISSNTITMETCWKVQFLCELQEKKTELSCEQGDAMGGTMKNKYYHCKSEAEIANLSWDIQAWCRDYNWMAGSYVISWCRFIKSSTLEMQIRPDTACVYVYWDEEGGGKNRLFDWTTSCMPDYS